MADRLGRGHVCCGGGRRMKTGIVEKIEFTSGGAGNQWTTIDGVKYATWWDLRTKEEALINGLRPLS